MSKNNIKIWKEIRIWAVTTLVLWMIKLIPPHKKDKEYIALKIWFLKFPHDKLK